MTAETATGAPLSPVRTGSARRRSRPARAFTAAVIVALALFAGVGCEGPCQALADKVCGCEPNRTEENACVQARRAAMSRTVSSAEATVCEQRLDTCTCAALEDQNLAACGLAK